MTTQFGTRLRSFREARGLAPATVDEYLGVMRGSCTNWENGYSMPEEELLEELAGYYRVKVTDLKMPHSVENKAVGWYYSGKQTEEEHTMARKTYTEEEKQAILKRAAETSALAASKEMGVSRAAIMKWQKEAKEAAGAEAPVEKKPRGRKKAAEKAADAPAKKPRGRKKAAERAADAPAEKKPRGRKKVEKAAEENKKPAVQVFVQSPFGHEITPDVIRDKVGEVDTIYIRVDQNKIYWVKGEETGAVDIW
jgi:transcriptional regulator with XRE-family HTH domain